MSTTNILSAFLLGLVACATTAGLANAQDGSSRRTFEVEAVKDITYYDGPNADAKRHKCDVFYPRGGEKCPVVVLVHGGVWMMGDKSCVGLYSAVGKFLARNGIVAVLPNYRLTPWVKHPEHVKDVARAVAWTRKNCGKYGGRADHLFIAGHSAGGHLVALLATDEQYLKAEGLKRSDIRGVMAISGVYRIPEVNVRLDFNPDGEKSGVLAKVAPISDLDINLPLLMPANGGKTAFDWKVSPFSLVFGDDPKMRKDASPIEHIERGLPPFLILYAERDLPTLAPMADEFGKALKDKGCEAEVRKIPRRNHHSIMFDATTLDDPVADAMLDFIRKHTR
jgi:acetyl esterase/lipase